MTKENKLFCKNIRKHFMKICQHKWYVFLNCCKASKPWAGIKHDMSKFSPVEFFESAKYYNGKNSPIDTSKKINGYSAAWLHHKGRNKHHCEYWIDNNIAIKMPYKYAIELVCDYLGAGKAYMQNGFTYLAEYRWWEQKRTSVQMHLQTKIFVELMLDTMRYEKSNDCLRKNRSYFIYKIAENLSKEKEDEYLHLFLSYK